MMGSAGGIEAGIMRSSTVVVNLSETLSADKLKIKKPAYAGFITLIPS